DVPTKDAILPRTTGDRPKASLRSGPLPDVEPAPRTALDQPDLVLALDRVHDRLGEQLEEERLDQPHLSAHRGVEVRAAGLLVECAEQRAGVRIVGAAGRIAPRDEAD